MRDSRVYKQAFQSSKVILVSFVVALNPFEHKVGQHDPIWE